MTELLVCAAHPTSAFGAETAALVAEVTGARAVCVVPRRGVALEAMVDDLEAERLRTSAGRWVFWGMSGGGWLAQIYAHRHPEALRGIIVESACVSFRRRLADPTCALSPFYPAWRELLAARGLVDEGSHERAAPADDAEWIEVGGVGHVSRPWIGELRLPALVIAGSADPVVPVARVREVHEAISGSRWVVIDGGGHVPTTEKRPEAVAAIRGFLDDM